MVSGTFWAGRKVFITGHTGFMGGWLALWASRLGAEVSGYALAPPTEPSFFAAVGLERRVAHRLGDVRDGAALTGAMTAAGPEIVFHLAAQPIVRTAYAAPVDTYATNVMGTVNLLEAVRLSPSVRRVVVVTTDKVYDNQEWPWGYRESDRLGGKEPYGTSKACCEFVTDAYRQSYLTARGVSVATVRAGNIIGGGDWAADRLIPDAVRAFQAGRELVIRNPLSVRPWQHVLDMVKGCLMLAERLEPGAADGQGPWNFGPQAEECEPVGWIADRLVSLWGAGAAWRLADGERPYEAAQLRLDSARARGPLGWRPVWRLGRALDLSAGWYKQFYAGDDMAAASIRQIEENQNG